MTAVATEKAPRWGTLKPGKPSPATPRRLAWLELRRRLGQQRDRLAWLQFMCSVTSYRPEPWQVRVHLARSHDPGVRANKLVSAGIRTGKTLLASAEAFMLHVANPGCNHLFLAPTYDQVREVVLPAWMKWVEEAADAGYPILRKMNQSLLRGDLHCGGRVYFRSAEKYHHIRGYEFASVNFDETEFARKALEAMLVLLGRISSPHAYVRQFTATSSPSPNGLSGGLIEFWHKQRELAKRLPPGLREQALAAWWFLRAKTTDNPHLPPDFFRGVEGYSKRRYLEEILAYSFASSTRVWPEYGTERHVVKYQFNPERPYVICCDWGYHFPYFGFLQFVPDLLRSDLTRHPAWVLFWEWGDDHVAEGRQMEELRKVARHLGRHPMAAAVDPEDSGMIELLRHEFPNCEMHFGESKSERSVKRGVDAVRAMLDPLFSEPRLLVADHLTTQAWAEGQGHRGFHATALNYPWKALHGAIVDRAPDKDSRYAHCGDSIGYFARELGDGVERVFDVPKRMGGHSADDLEEVLRQLSMGRAARH